MKKIHIYILVAAMVIPAFQSCKKGENDPFLSFRSRKARVAGDWKVVSSKGSQTETGSFGNSFSWTYDGTTYTETDASGTVSYPETVTYTFEKDGNYSYTRVSDGNTSSATGTWNFLAGVGDAKNKERMVLRSISYTSSSYSITYDMTDYDDAFEIDELRNDRMVWKRKMTYSFPDGTSGVAEEEYTLEPK
jgi:hypothetical protein